MLANMVNEFTVIAKFANGVSQAVGIEGNSIESLVETMRHMICDEQFISPVSIWWIENEKGEIVFEA